MSEKEMRELDAWIAEHVMGWQNDIEGSGYFYEETLAGPARAIDYHEWQPTLDRAAAMEVLEKCVTKVATRSMEIYQGVNEGPEFRPCFCVTMEGMSDVMFADTLPLAVCLFARKIYEKDNS